MTHPDVTRARRVPRRVAAGTPLSIKEPPATAPAGDTPIFQQAEVSSETQHALAQLREAIVSGRLHPGDRLIETELAEQMELSRGPIREAIRLLAREGLVALRQNRGAVVTSVTVEDVLEVYALRAALGSLALRQLVAGRRATPQVCQRLKLLATRAKSKSARNDQHVLLERELAFQEAIVEESGLRRVAARFRELSVEIRRFINILSVTYEDVDQILGEVDQLLAAIRDQDLRRAEHVWHGRFRRAVTEFVALIPEGDKLLEERPWLLTAVDDYLGERRDNEG